MTDITITNEQKVHVKLNPVTAKGNPASIDGAATFSVESGDGTFEADADGLGAFLISGTAVGDTVYKVVADADLGEGVVNIEDSINLHVIAPQASGLGLTVDAPEDK